MIHSPASGTDGLNGHQSLQLRTKTGSLAVAHLSHFPKNEPCIIDLLKML